MSLSELQRGIRQIGRESWLLFLALSLTNASNYVFHVVVSRLLGPADYGALGALLAVLIVMSVPLSALQTTVARRVAEHPERADEEKSKVWAAAFRSVIPLGITVTVVVGVVSPALTLLLRLESPVPAFFLAVYVLPATLGAVLRGALQGTMQFRKLAFVSALPVLVRLSVGISLVYAGAGIIGATAATVLAEGVGLVASWLALRVDMTYIRRAAAQLRELLREFAPTASALAALWLLIELDLVLARRFLPAGQAGDYAAAGMLARAVLFVPGAISLIALPRFAKNRARGTEAYRWLLSSCAVVSALGVGATAIIILARSAIIDLTFGDDFLGAAETLPVLCVAMVFLGIVNLLVYFHIAAGSRLHQFLWASAVLEGAAITMFHGSPRTIATVVLVTSVLLCILGLIAARSLTLAKPPMSKLPRELWVHTPGLAAGDAIALELSVVVPSYNAGASVSSRVRNLTHVLGDLGRTFEVIVVSDGSNDDSILGLVSSHPSVNIVHYPKRQGKGVALRVGMSRARGRFVAFIDADDDLNPQDLVNFMSLMDLYDPHIVLGSKRHPLSTVAYPPARRAMSWLYQRLVRILFGLNVRDTQTGIKMIRRDVLEAILPRMLEKRFAFDLELLVVARLLGYHRFFEAPVTLDYQFKSTVSPRAVLEILTDTAAIFYRRYILRYYNDPQTTAGLSSYLEATREFPLFAAVEAAQVEQAVSD